MSEPVPRQKRQPTLKEIVKANWRLSVICTALLLLSVAIQIRGLFI